MSISLIEDHKQCIDQLPTQSSITMCVQIKKSYGQSHGNFPFVLNNLEWTLDVYNEATLLTISLNRTSNLSCNWSGKIDVNISSLDTETKERKFIKHVAAFAGPRLFIRVSTFLVWYNKHRSHIDMHYQELAQLKATNAAIVARNAELTRKLAFYEKDKEKMEMFSQVMRLFEAQHCSKYECELQLANNKVHFQMMKIEDREDGGNGDNNETEPADAKKLKM